MVLIQLMAGIDSKCKLHNVTKLVSGDFFFKQWTIYIYIYSNDLRGCSMMYICTHMYSHTHKKSKSDKTQDLGYW